MTLMTVIPLLQKGDGFTSFDLQDAIKLLHWIISNIANGVELLPNQGLALGLFTATSIFTKTLALIVHGRL